MLRIWTFLLLALLPSVCQAADKETLQLQREVALLNDDVRTLRWSMEQKMNDMTALLQRTVEQLTEVREVNSQLRSTLADYLRRQEKTVNVPVANFGAKLDRLSSDSLAVKDTIAGLNARLKRLELKLTDIETAVTIMQAPPPPPSISEALGGPPAGVTAQSLFLSAMKDQLAGNYELALREFQDYLRFFGNTELAVASQFHIGEIRYYQGDLDLALEAFESVIECYPKSGKAPDALYLKAKVLERQNHRSRAVEELNLLARTYPHSDAANRVRAELERLRAVAASTKTPSPR